jgi:hypothetical protein
MPKVSKHVLYDKDEVLERMTHEFNEGMNALDSLESGIRVALDALTAMQFHNEDEAPKRRPRPRVKKSPLPTAADHLSADLLAQELAGRRKVR